MSRRAAFFGWGRLARRGAGGSRRREHRTADAQSIMAAMVRTYLIS